MLFMGTEKYPDESQYGTFVESVGGGYTNAFTATDHTNYYFEVTAGKLLDTLDM
jgi:secreted Zn-dependent insulinase-like peptidase